MITTQNEKAFAKDLKELMKKHGVSIEEDKKENYEEWRDVLDDGLNQITGTETNYRFSGPSIDIAIADFEIYRRISRNESNKVSSDKTAA